MFQKIGVATLALAGMMAFAAPRQADAAVRFGIGIGGPAYTYPVAPAYPYYANPYYADPYVYPAPPPLYTYPGYVAPGFGIGFGWGGGYGGHFHGHAIRGHRR